jgi:hypothetical protein
MELNLSAALLMGISWAVIATTTVWCFWRMLGEDRRNRKK